VQHILRTHYYSRSPSYTHTQLLLLKTTRGRLVVS